MGRFCLVDRGGPACEEVHGLLRTDIPFLTDALRFVHRGIHPPRVANRLTHFLTDQEAAVPACCPRPGASYWARSAAEVVVAARRLPGRHCRRLMGSAWVGWQVAQATEPDVESVLDLAPRGRRLSKRMIHSHVDCRPPTPRGCASGTPPSWCRSLQRRSASITSTPAPSPAATPADIAAMTQGPGRAGPDHQAPRSRIVPACHPAAVSSQ